MDNKWLRFLLIAYATIATLTIIFFDGTGDSGDSILHYLFAKYAPNHPELFFDHWAKPFFVLLASPFAQFGFIGMKIFNTLTTLLAIFFTVKSIEKMNLKNSLLGGVILIFTPLYYILTFSGLTEPLFACFISMGLFCVLDKRNILACILISFLPFVRSEGLIILGIFGLYFLIKKDWKAIPFLLFGHITYAFAGFFVYGDLLWIFNKIPYAKLSSVYGEGTWNHFIQQLYYVVGLPIYVLFGVGTIAILWKAVQRKFSWELHIIVLLGFYAFFIAHSLFWYLGIFNSMGLNRVLVGVSPMTAIIALVGFNFLSEELLSKVNPVKKAVQFVLIALIIVFPLASSPASINFDETMMLSNEQKCANKATDFVRKEIKNGCVLLSAPYLSESLKIDHFNPSIRNNLTKNFEQDSKSGDILIWDNWFSVVEFGVNQDLLDNHPKLEELYEARDEQRGREIIYKVYRRI